jgi:PAS domain S-box-containing protein
MSTRRTDASREAGQDSTERSWSEEWLREKERMLARLISNLPGMVYRCANDPDWTMAFVSDGCKSVTGYEADELLHNRVISYGNLIHPDDRDWLWEKCQASLDSRTPCENEYRIIARNSDVRWVWERASGVYHSDGRLLFIEGFIQDITARKQARQILQQREALYRTLAESTPVGIWQTTPDGELVYINPAMCRLLEVDSPDGMRGKTYRDFWTPESIDRVQREHAKRLAGLSTSYEVEMVGARGTRRRLAIHGAPVFDADGTVESFIASILDVTEQKQAEEELHKLAALIRHSDEFVGLATLDGQVTFLNPTALNLVGLDGVEDAASTTILDYVPAEDQQRVGEQILPQVFADGLWQGELRFRHFGTGRLIPLDFSGFIVRDPGTGQPQFLACVARDITERKKAEAALRESESNLAAAQAQARMGSWELDIAAERGNWSREMFRIFDRDPDLGAPSFPEFLAMVHPEDRESLLAAQSRAIREGGAVKLEFRSHPERGPVKWFEGRCVTQRNAAGAPIRLAGTTQEITERKRAEQALRGSREQLRDFARRLQVIREEERTGIAREIHDVLAQELTCLKLNLAWVARRLSRSVDEPTRAALAEKVSSMTDLADVTIQSVQKLATDLRPVVLDSLGLGPAIEWQAEDFQKRTGIACEARVACELPALDRAQATALFRIVQESLTNVARHAGARRVEVALDHEAGGLCLTVRDDGRGITAEELADPKSIGLLGMKERAALLGGTTEIAAVADGGTIVRVITPLLAAKQKEKQP